MDRGRNPGNAEILEVVQSRFGFVILPWRSGTVQRAVEICGHDRVRRGRHPVNMPDPALRFAKVGPHFTFTSYSRPAWCGACLRPMADARPERDLAVCRTCGALD